MSALSVLQYIKKNKLEGGSNGGVDSCTAGDRRIAQADKIETNRPDIQ